MRAKITTAIKISSELENFLLKDLKRINLGREAIGKKPLTKSAYIDLLIWRLTDKILELNMKDVVEEYRDGKTEKVLSFKFNPNNRDYVKILICDKDEKKVNKTVKNMLVLYKNNYEKLALKP